MDTPHDAAITQLVFRNVGDEQQLISTSLDCTFKVWLFVDTNDVTGGNCPAEWSLSGTYAYRCLPAHAGALNADKQVLAVGFDSQLTLWRCDQFVCVADEVIVRDEPVV